MSPARSAAAEARRLDMPGLLRAADAFLAGTAAETRAEDPLTPREREVAGLVAQALSNREVARPARSGTELQQLFNDLTRWMGTTRG